MSMSDPIADMLTRIRNAMVARHPDVEIPWSRTKEEVCALLKREGFLRECSLVDAGANARIRVELKYLEDRTPVIQGLRRVSSPSLRVYAGYRDLRPVRSGLGITVLSTPKGIMTGKQARTEKVGGEVLCEVW